MKDNKQILFSGTILATAAMAANVINLLFNAALGRVVSTQEFGIITLINTFLYFGSMVYNALLITVNHKVARLDNNISKRENFMDSLTKQVIFIASLAALFWGLLVPFSSNFFNINQPIILYLFTPLFIFFPLAALGKGYLQGRLFFIYTALIIFIEPVLKFITATVFYLISPSEIYLSIYISIILTGIISIFLVFIKKPKLNINAKYKFPFKFFFITILTGLSTVSFLAADVILVKHYLSPIQAGEYAFLSLLGKIIYFLGSLLSIFTISLYSREIEGRKDPLISFYWLFAGAFFLCTLGIIFFGFFGSIFIPLVFSNKANAIIPYAIPYTIAIALFTLGNTIVSYHLAKRQYIFPILALAISILLILGIIFYHQNITEIIYILLAVALIYLLSLLIVHFNHSYFISKVRIKYLEENLYEES